MAEDKEVEIQVKIGDVEPLLKFLEENAEFKGEKLQIDEYFSPPHRDFTVVRPVKEWLRLRNASGVCSINYKNWHFDGEGKSHYCDEYESEIGGLDKVKKILAVLNFKSLVVVDKVRRIWIYDDFEISVDSVKGLGDFVEIEYKGNEEIFDPKKITESMIEFLKNVGCNGIKRNFVGYPFLLLFSEEAEWESQ